MKQQVAWTAAVLVLAAGAWSAARVLAAPESTEPAAADADDAADDELDDAHDVDEPVPLADVPAHLRAVAEAAVPGLVLERAEREVEDGREQYCLEGVADGETVEVEVDLDGNVHEIERGDED